MEGIFAPISETQGRILMTLITIRATQYQLDHMTLMTLSKVKLNTFQKMQSVCHKTRKHSR